MSVFAPICAALLTASPKYARAAPLDPNSDDWEGLTQFVELAASQVAPPRTIVASHLNLGKLHKEDALFIVHPKGSLDVAELMAFLQAGGRIVLLDDYGSGDELLHSFAIARVPLPAKPAAMLRGNPALAIAEPVNTFAAVRDIGPVVTNHATGLERHGLAVVLKVRGEGEPDVSVALAGTVGHGRFLAVGDASIAMNSMLRYPGNRALADALVRYAMHEDEWGPRDGKLYILANDFTMGGAFGADSDLGASLGDRVKWLNGQLESLRQQGVPPLIAYVIALALGLALVGWTSARAGRTHRAVLPRFAKAVPRTLQGGLAGRAAVLGAPSTSRVLAMLELKSALEDDLAVRLELQRAPSIDDLTTAAAARGILDARQVASLRDLLKGMGALERQLSTKDRRSAQRIYERDVVAAAARVRELLKAAEQGRDNLSGTS